MREGSDLGNLPSRAEVAEAVAVASGRRAGTLLLKNARVVNVFTNEILESDVLLAGRLIAAVCPGLDADADTVLDLDGGYLAPGLIDGHLHLESALVTPAEYARAVVGRGVTGVVCDPHEVANVAGEQGVAWLLDATEGLPLDVWVTVPSCIPSSPFETVGADFPLTAMERLLEHPRVVGIAEIMSYPAVVAGDPEVLAKAALAERWAIPAEGHAPGVGGRTLQAYLASGIGSDHESTTLEEGREKLRAGAFLMVREGSVTRDLAALLPLLEPNAGDRIGFVTDDRLPHDLLSEGGVDHVLRSAIAGGVDPAYAFRCATINNALHYRLARRGAVAPGYFADLVAFGSLDDFRATSVYKDGRLVATDGVLAPNEVPERAGSPVDATVTHTVRLPKRSRDSLRLPLQPRQDGEPGSVRCIVALDNQIVTTTRHLAPRIVDGAIVQDVDQDVLKLACVERHGRTGGLGVGLVSGFGLKAGALASSVGHDHHNLMVVGVDDDDMVAAMERLQQLGGGLVAIRDGVVLAELALPLAGLITDQPLDEVKVALDALDAAAASLGNRLPAPFMALSFLGLPVIPSLRLTDMGLVDVELGRLVPLASQVPGGG
ncbi:MAG TPA: adenine deaminase [Trueperaceae bacterium]|nr:adenine deaminase [Trueperaceae bacterium]